MVSFHILLMASLLAPLPHQEAYFVVGHELPSEYVYDVKYGVDVSQEDKELLALMAMAEAEGEDELGQRLVISTALNRVNSPQFPDTVYGVIYQKGAFSSMWGSRVEACYVSDYFLDLVESELENRTDYEVLYFRTRQYASYGTPAFKVGNHYFNTN